MNTVIGSPSTSTTVVQPVQTVPQMPTVRDIFSAKKKLGEATEQPFPIMDRVWDIFSGKGIKTVFLSIGSSVSALPDLELAESLGCPLHVAPLSEAQRNAWAEVSAILKERKRDPATAAHEFSKGAESKWILPKNIRVANALPWWTTGSADLSGVTIQTEAMTTYLEKACREMKLKDAATRLDVLKIDTASVAPGLEVPLLQATLHAGFRPAVVLVNWSRAPDMDLMATMGAGHLQNCGYRLCGKIGTRFMYFFTDNDMYQICSWENDAVANPLVMEILKSAHEQLFNSSSKPEEASA